MSVPIQSNQVITLTLNPAAVSLSAADSGKLILLGPQAQASTITLPALQAGLHFRIQTTVSGLNGGAGLLFNVAVNSAVAGNLRGSLILPGGNSTQTAAGPVTFVTGAGPGNICAIGDYVDLYCDGTHWSSTAIGGIAGGMTAP